MGLHGCAVGGGVGGLEAGLVIDHGAHHHHRRGPAAGVSPMCGRDAGGPAVTRSGRRHRRRRRAGLRCPLRRVGGQRLGQPAAYRGQTRTPPRSRPSGTAALDHQNHRRPVDLLADQTRRARRRHVRRRAAVAPRRADRRLETRPRHPTRRRRGRRGRGIRSGAAATHHPGRVHPSGRGGLGLRRRRPPARAAHHRRGAPRRGGAHRRAAPGPAARRRRPAAT